MFLRLLIKSGIFCALIMAAGTSFGQESQRDLIESPYRNEYNPWFEFNVFKRGYKNEPLAKVLDSLEATPRKYWTRSDSLIFAQTSMKTGNFDLAAYYFDNLKVNYKQEEEFWWDQLILHFLNREYNTCIQVITKAEPGVVEFSKLYFFKKICQAKLRALRDEDWYEEESVLSWEIDSSLMLLDKDDPEFHEKVIEPLENLRFVLEKLIRHIHSDDEVLARTCLEMGWIIEAYISPRQAFIAMSLGRQYDTWDREITENIKRIKAVIIEKKYRIPIFRQYFPRIEHWRFDYQVLKEQIIYERNDTVVRTKPVLRKDIPEKDFMLSPELLIPGGVAVMFLAVLIFLKTRKK